MNYVIRLETREWPGAAREVVLNNGYVVGLRRREQEDCWIHVGEVPPVEDGWNGPHSVAEPRKFYAGISDLPVLTWQHAVLGALYDLFQVHDGLKDGDTFEATHPVTGEVARFVADGVHVVPA